jgi:hypothetical protein
MSDKIQLINDLFAKIAHFEEGSANFHTHEFIENFSGVLALFPAVRDNVSEIKEIDQILSRRTQEFNVNRSDLRQLCVHLLTMFFKFSANAPSPYDRCYLSSREKRRPRKDAGFVTEVLIPRLFSSGSLRNDFELKYYLLKRVNEFQQKFGGRRPIYDTISPDEAWKLPRHILFADLVARYDQDSGRIHKEGMIENRLYQSGKFKLLAREDPFLEYLLLKLEYLEVVRWYIRWWAKIVKGIGRILGTLHLGFIRYLFTKRRAAYLFYVFLILLILVGGVAVPFLWRSINQNKLERLERNTLHSVEASSVTVSGEDKEK